MRTRDKLFNWALGVKSGETIEPEPELPFGFFEQPTAEEASYLGPRRRIKRAMIAYAKADNIVRWNRLQRDFAWLKRCMEEMDQNPEDARYLLGEK